MSHKLIQRNFIVIWIIVLLSLALVFTLILTGCQKTKVISAKEIPKETEKPAAPAQPNTTVSTKNASTAKNVSAEAKPAVTATADSSSKKDLNLAGVLADTIYPKSNEIFEVTLTVENAGLEKIDSFEYLVNIMKDGVLQKFDRGERNEGLVAGGKVKLRSEFSLSSAGKYTIEASVDPSNAVKEFDESNNGKTTTITIVAPSAETTQENEAPAPAPSGTCTDTDNGKIYTLKGKCTDSGAYSAGFNDFCISATRLVEMYCKSGECVQEEHACSCSEGKCS